MLEDVELHALQGAVPIAILGLTPATLKLLETLSPTGLINSVSGVYFDGDPARAPALSVPVYGLKALQDGTYSMLVVAEDRLKEDLLHAALPFISGVPRIVVAGYGHLQFRDEILDQEESKLSVPSLANGYPEVLTHIYQCLSNCARLGLSGVVAEFGMFQGGTTMLISRLIERLGQSWHVIGFDTFGGFPPRRSPLDMYDHPDCVYKDIDATRQYLSQRDVEIVVGDIVDTRARLLNEDIVLSFIDTDNFTSSMAALEIVRERTVIGGAIVFDHLAGRERFRYTLGERIAATTLLDDPRYFHLHGNGVFYRQR